MKKIFSIVTFILLLTATNSWLSEAAESKNEPYIFEPILIEANKIKTKDTEATYASEIYNQKEIKESGAKTIYEFLNQSTSVVSMPSSGNPFSQKLDLRGFGISEGAQTIVITVNGRRLQNIDNVPQNLSSISIQNIDRIEITKGSGSVIYGDGATGGTIQIYTKDDTDTSIGASVGNFGRRTSTMSTGFSTEKFQFSVLGDHYKQGGFSDKGSDGNRDEGELLNSKVSIQYKPTESSEFSIGKKHTYLEYRFPNLLTRSTFEQNPGSNDKGTTGATNYTHQTETTDSIVFGSSIKLNKNIEQNLDYSLVEQTRVITNARRYKTHYIDESLKYLNGPLTLITGGQYWYGDRRCDDCSSPSTATKQNVGLYLQGQYKFNSTVLSLGARNEWIRHTYKRTDIEALSLSSESIEAFDIGVNQTVNKNLNIFSNFNKAFQTPNIDYLFNFDGEFAGFIRPSSSKTLNIGLNYLTTKSKTKLTLFGTKLKDEIFFNRHNSGFGDNISIDRSSKYGFELQNKYSFTDSLSVSINYAYIRAIIDREDSDSNCVNNCAGNDLPGVSRHNLTVGVNIEPTENSKVILTQSYRSHAFADEDLNNAIDPSDSSSPQHKTPEFIKTDIAYLHTYTNNSKNLLFGSKQIDFSAKVENLFERSHGTTLRTDVIFPSLFTRNFMFGVEFKY
jgi:iron complex outermembrane receptor protein